MRIGNSIAYENLLVFVLLRCVSEAKTAHGVGNVDVLLAKLQLAMDFISFVVVQHLTGALAGREENWNAFRDGVAKLGRRTLAGFCFDVKLKFW